MNLAEAVPPAPDRASAGYLRASAYGAVGLAGGAVLGRAIVLAAMAGKNGDWDDLARTIFSIALGGTLGLLAGAVLIAVALRRARLSHPVVTALVFIPVAALLASFTFGLGAFAGPAVARWLVLGFSRRSAAGLAENTTAGRGAPQDGLSSGPAGLLPSGVTAPDPAVFVTAAPRATGRLAPWALRTDGLAQRLVVVAALVAAASFVVLFRFGPSLGGSLRGPWLVFLLAAIPALVVPPVMLRRHLRLPGLALVSCVLLALVAAAVPGATSSAKLSPERIVQLADRLGAPDGQTDVTQVRFVIGQDYQPGVFAQLPVIVVQSAPRGERALLLPAPLRGDATGSLMPAGAAQTSGGRGPLDAYGAPGPLKPTVRGLLAAAHYRTRLLATGWEEQAVLYPGTRSPWPWLPRELGLLLDTDVRYTHRGFLYAAVLPYADGAIVVITAQV